MNIYSQGKIRFPEGSAWGKYDFFWGIIIINLLKSKVKSRAIAFPLFMPEMNVDAWHSICNQTRHTEMLPRCCGTEEDFTAFFNIRWCSLWRLKDVFVSLFYVRLGHKNWHWKEREFWRAPALLTRHPSMTRVFWIYIVSFHRGIMNLNACTHICAHIQTHI